MRVYTKSRDGVITVFDIGLNSKKPKAFFKLNGIRYID